MDLSISRLATLILGVVLLIAGVYFLIQAIPAKDWIEGLFALIGIAIGFALVSGKGININT